jgi:mono/diheme cytochrome c family protein
MKGRKTMKNKVSTKTKFIIVSAPIAFVLFVIFAANSSQTMVKVEAAGGAEVYAQSCSRCHGGDGKSQTGKGKQTHATDLTTSTISDAKGIKVIANGKGSMPGFKGTITDAEMTAVMAYVKGFRR